MRCVFGFVKRRVRSGVCFVLLACCLPARGAAAWERVEVDRYSVDSPFWWPRIRHLVVDYIPHIMDLVENDRSERKKPFARLKALARRRAGEDVRNPCEHNWAEAAVHNTFEAMCLALAVDPRGDAEVIGAQERIRAGIERWIPVILAAQEEDGYLCADAQMRGFPRFFSPPVKPTGEQKKNPRFPVEDLHEGYLMGYFMESAVAHYRATNGDDRRMYSAAKKAADLFCDTIGPAPKLEWQPDHPGLEQALTRFGLFVNDVEGAGAGDKYLRLAEWLLQTRGVTPPHEDAFRQKNKPLAMQKQPYGHAVMFGYLYSGAADAARLAGNEDLGASCDRLWDALVNRKMYVTGAIGSSDESFGAEYELPNDAKMGETCANISNLYFQNNLQLLREDAKYADLAELVLYNGILGSVSLGKPEWQYFNPLDQAGFGHKVSRAGHEPDCCMGNIPRTLLRLPTWIYAKSADGFAVNQFIGGMTRLRGVGGTDVTVVQKTNYPWDGQVQVVVRPDRPRRFAVRIRVPDRHSSRLYTPSPKVGGLEALAVNGSSVDPVLKDGYAVIEREWAHGDRIDFRVPLQVQRVHADERVVADRGRVALQYGPLVYNFESVDLPPGKSLDDVALAADAPLAAEWDASLLGGVKAIRGKFADGTPLLAVPHYARMNRSDGAEARSVVWVREVEEARTNANPPAKSGSR